MADQYQVDLLKEDIDNWRQWRMEDGYGVKVDLSGADFYAADLSYTNLIKADLSGAILEAADLSYTDLSWADLSKANLSMADLWRANLWHANLSGADLREANLSGVNLSEADLSGADIREADLSGVNLSEANLSNADLTGCRIYASSAWKVQLNEKTTQTDLIITPESEPDIRVSNLELAQFIYLLLNYEKLRDVLNSVMERGVLLLGRFNDGGLELLQVIAAKLRNMKYLPIIFDFDRPDNRNLTETVMTLVGLSRFVIVDLSGRSVANELRSTVPHFKVPFVPIIEESRKKDIYSMFSDFLEDDWVLPLVEFKSREHLMELLPSKIINPAEKKCTQRQRRLKTLFKR